MLSLCQYYYISLLCCFALIATVGGIGGNFRGDHHELEQPQQQQHNSVSSTDERCEPLDSHICKQLNLYNRTRLPNFFGHDTQSDAGLEINQFWPLVKINCSSILGIFLCTMYFPLCLPDYDRPLPPCRSLCEDARDGCAPLMRRYGFEWPKHMNCSQLPVYGDSENLCMQPPEYTGGNNNKHNDNNNNKQNQIDDVDHQYDLGDQNNILLPKLSPPDTDLISSGSAADNAPTIGGSGKNAQCRCECRDHFRPVPKDYHPTRQLYVGNLSDCTYPCKSPYFSPEEQNFTMVFVGVLSVVCLLSSMGTLATFLIEMDRFRYPERSIIWMSLCYGMVAIGYLCSLIATHERTACDLSHDTVRAGTMKSGLCTVVFVLTYFFGMAQGLWWVILSLTWFLAAGLKWSSEAITHYAQYFHLVCWMIPAIQTFAVLAVNAVDGDPVAGVCFVGHTSLAALRGFVLAPLTVYLILGCVFLFLGFASLLRVRRALKRAPDADKLNRLIVRIGCTSLLYTFPATVLVGCYFYEQYNRDLWEYSLICNKHCFPGGEQERQRPHYVVFMIKYLVLLIVGVTSSVWVWSPKTYRSWKRFLQRRCCCCCCPGDEPVYQRADAILIKKSHTDISVPVPYCHKQYPLSHL